MINENNLSFPRRCDLNMAANRSTDFDIALLGGGLHHLMFLLACQYHQKNWKILLLDNQPCQNASQTWSFFDSDIPCRARPWLDSAVAAKWPAYDVFFPSRQRRVATAYYSMHAREVRSLVDQLSRQNSNITVHWNHEAKALNQRQVVWKSNDDDGKTHSATARLIFDGRGWSAQSDLQALPMGYQKFLGWELEFPVPHGVEFPWLMDARVDQLDGFRFLYVLPFSSTRLIVEDTCFSDTPELNQQTLANQLTQYLQAQNWGQAEVCRVEKGVLPMPWRPVPGQTPWKNGIWQTGLRGGWFHPATGYSVPLALAWADRLARACSLDSLPKTMRSLQRRYRFNTQGSHLLNFLLFRCYHPDQRWRVLQWFYRLPTEVIGRFYSLSLRGDDWLKIFNGVPPSGWRRKR